MKDWKASVRLNARILTIAGTAVALAAACGARRVPAPDGGCEVVVSNRTSVALDARLVTGPASSASLGGLNPGESLTHVVPCAQGQVVVRGIPIVTSGFFVGAVQGSAELVAGERATVLLQGRW